MPSADNDIRAGCPLLLALYFLLTLLLLALPHCPAAIPELTGVRSMKTRLFQTFLVLVSGCGQRGVLAYSSSGECIFRTKILATEETIIFTIPPHRSRALEKTNGKWMYPESHNYDWLPQLELDLAKISRYLLTDAGYDGQKACCNCLQAVKRHNLNIRFVEGSN